MNIKSKEFSNAVKDTKSYEDLLIRLITLECNQGIHTETGNNTKFPNPNNDYYCLNCGEKVT